MAIRCGECGRFVRVTFPVWGPIQSSGVDHEACGDCRPELKERFDTPSDRSDETQKRTPPKGLMA